MSNGPISILRILTLRCADADRLMSDSLDRRLGWAEGAALRGHLLVCRACRRARRQLQVLRQAMRSSFDRGDTTLSPEARERIRATLDNPG